MFGENPTFFDPKNPGDSTTGYILMYILGTNLINIICLNILISIVTDNYDYVIQKFDYTDSIYKAQVLL